MSCGSRQWYNCPFLYTVKKEARCNVLVFRIMIVNDNGPEERSCLSFIILAQFLALQP